jgi:D-glycero-D-manno-heptose 1,7-bisphosphate phosphatase
MRLIILDRDGVINEDSDEYIKSPDEWHALPGSLEAIARLTKANYRVIVASNQSGLARRMFDIQALNRIHHKMHQHVTELGGQIEAIFFCPHAPKDHCDCRKPRNGLFREISRRLCINLDNVPVVGDSLRDIQAARSAGARPILVRTGKGAATLSKHAAELRDVAVYDNLAEAVDALLLNGEAA